MTKANSHENNKALQVDPRRRNSFCNKKKAQPLMHYLHGTLLGLEKLFRFLHDADTLAKMLMTCLTQSHQSESPATPHRLSFRHLSI